MCGPIVLFINKAALVFIIKVIIKFIVEKSMSILNRGLKNTGSQVLKGFFLFLLSILLARFLGPKLFGIYSVFGVIALQLWGVLDSGLQRAFFYTTSSAAQPKSFYSLYIIIFVSQVILGLIFTSVLYLNLDVYKEASQFFNFGLAILVFTGLMSQKSMLNTTTMLADLGRRSWIGNAVEAVSYCTHCIFLLWIMEQGYSQELFLRFLLFQNVSNVFFSIFLVKKFVPIFDIKAKVTYRDHLLKLWIYCRPLVPYLLMSSVIISFEQVLLLAYGSEEQAGFYAIAVRLGLICIVITSGFLNIISREISELSSLGKLNEVKKLIMSGVELVFLVSSVIAGFFLFFSEEVVLFLYGSEYLEAATVQIIYCLYIPVQAVGQLVAACYFALAKTKLYASAQMLAQVLGLLLFYIVIKFFAEEISNRSDVALAAKILVVYIFSHGYCYLQIVGKDSGVSSVVKLVSFAVLVIVIGMVSKNLGYFIVGLNLSLHWVILLSGMVYAIFALTLIYVLDNVSKGALFRKNFLRLMST